MLLNNVAPDCWLNMGAVVTEACLPACVELIWDFSERGVDVLSRGGGVHSNVGVLKVVLS